MTEVAVCHSERSEESVLLRTQILRRLRLLRMTKEGSSECRSGGRMAVGFVRIATLVVLARNNTEQQYVILNEVKNLLCWKTDS